MADERKDQRQLSSVSLSSPVAPWSKAADWRPLGWETKSGAEECGCGRAGIYKGKLIGGRGPVRHAVAHPSQPKRASDGDSGVGGRSAPAISHACTSRPIYECGH